MVLCQSVTNYDNWSWDLQHVKKLIYCFDNIEYCSKNWSEYNHARADISMFKGTVDPNNQLCLVALVVLFTRWCPSLLLSVQQANRGQWHDWLINAFEINIRYMSKWDHSRTIDIFLYIAATYKIIAFMVYTGSSIRGVHLPVVAPGSFGSPWIPWVLVNPLIPESFFNPVIPESVLTLWFLGLG